MKSKNIELNVPAGTTIQDIMEAEVKGMEEMFKDPMLRSVFNLMMEDKGVSMDDMDKQLEKTKKDMGIK